MCLVVSVLGTCFRRQGLAGLGCSCTRYLKRATYVTGSGELPSQVFELVVRLCCLSWFVAMQEIESVPLFMTESPAEGAEVSDDLAALQALKFEDSTPEGMFDKTSDVLCLSWGLHGLLIVLERLSVFRLALLAEVLIV